MKKPFIQRVQSVGPDRSHERGVTMALVALAMVAIIAVAVLSIDVITLYLAREEAQRSADAGALAAARMISISGMTGDPNNSSGSWGAICGGATSPATLTASSVATQRMVGGGVPTTITVTYKTNSTSGPDCSTMPAAFGVNPMVTVKVQRTNLPTFFSRIWGNTGNTISATATAEAFNSSASDVNTNGGPTGSVTPVHPSCVKPWMVPNRNPFDGSCTAGACPPFVNAIGDGTIVRPGVQPTTANAVIGETFNLFANCKPGTSCVLNSPNNRARANIPSSTGGFVGGNAPSVPNLEYLPGAVQSTAIAVPSCATSGTGANTNYEPAVGGCDTTTVYQCGIPSASAATPNQIDLSENPGGGTGDTANGVACLLTNTATVPTSGQDSIDTTSYPYKITAGTANPTGLNNSLVTTSNSIVTLPIYDQMNVTSTPTNVTIVGFLQVFIHSVDANGNMLVTVLNVAGCGNGSAAPMTNPINGNSSPVPVRLITPP
jgi:hypothetical protein